MKSDFVRVVNSHLEPLGHSSPKDNKNKLVRESTVIITGNEKGFAIRKGMLCYVMSICDRKGVYWRLCAIIFLHLLRKSSPGVGCDLGEDRHRNIPYDHQT